MICHGRKVVEGGEIMESKFFFTRKIERGVSGSKNSLDVHVCCERG